MDKGTWEAQSGLLRLTSDEYAPEGFGARCHLLVAAQAPNAQVRLLPVNRDLENYVEFAPNEALARFISLARTRVPWGPADAARTKARLMSLITQK